MGELEVPADALWGAQTQRAVQNFPISGRAMPRGFIRAVALIKAACRARQCVAGTARPRQWPTPSIAAAAEVADGKYDAQFPVDVFQTGSGTSTNMNANEVIAHLAARRLGHAGASERRREHGPEQQRRDPHGDPRQRRAAVARIAAARAGSTWPRRCARRKPRSAPS